MHRTLASLLGSAGIGWLLLVSVSTPALAGDIFIEQPVAPRAPILVAPGATADWELIVRNDGTETVPLATLGAIAGYGLPAPTQWLFGPSDDPDCEPVRLVSVPLGPFLGVWEWRVDILGLAPGQRRGCIYPLMRDPTSVVDRVFGWRLVEPADDPGPTGNTATWVAGSPVRLQLTATPTCDGDPAPGIRHVRVALANSGQSPVDAVVFGTCIPPFPPFSVDSDIAGGCGANVGAPGACFMGGVGWRLGGIGPGESQSCLLALSAPTGEGGWPVRIAPPYPSGGLWVQELDPGQGLAALSMTDPPLVCGGPAPSPPAPVPGPRGAWLFALIAFLMTLAAIRVGTAGTCAASGRR